MPKKKGVWQTPPGVIFKKLCSLYNFTSLIIIKEIIQFEGKSFFYLLGMIQHTYNLITRVAPDFDLPNNLVCETDFLESSNV